MAGGQERILRGRIRTRPGDEEDHARHGADRRVADRQGPAARARRRAVLASRSPRSSGPRRRRWHGADSPLLAGRDEVRTTAYVVIDRRPRPVRRLQRRRAARRRGRDQGRRARRQGLPRSIPVGRKAEGYFRFRGYTHRRRRSPASATARRYADAKRDRRSTSSSCSPAARSTASSSSTPASSRAGTKRSCCARSCRSARHGRRRRRQAPAPADGAGRRLRVRARPGDDPRDAAAALRRGPHLRRPAQRRGVASTPSASGR